MLTNISNTYEEYFKSLGRRLQSIYKVAEEARKKGLDPSVKPECEVAEDLAALVEGLVGPRGVAASIRELSKNMSREELAFKIAEEIVYGKFGRFEESVAAEQAIRTALAILTEGITAAPVQGIAKVAIKQNFDGSRYLAIYFAGPIRSAGGTEQALTLVVGDFTRRLLGLDRYKPTQNEISRFLEELRLFERSVGRFQYHVSDEQLIESLQCIPIEVTGIESDPVEVSSFRNLPRVETNRVRGGALRVINDGIIGRAAKVSAIVEKLGIDGWEWLKNVKRSGEKKATGFMDEVIAGRPVFSFPSRCGGFRLRYGRARNTGLAAVGVHPATMFVLQGFLAAGTQLRLELPGKGGVVLPVDFIEPPVVRLKDGSVVKVSLENVNEVKHLVDKVLFLGDLLVSYGDFFYSNKSLVPSGFTEEWWREEFRFVLLHEFGNDLEKVADLVGIPRQRLQNFLENPFFSKPNAKEAVILAVKLGVSLHPSFTYCWSWISVLELKALRDWLFNEKTLVNKSEVGEVYEILGEHRADMKSILEKLCVPHKVIDGKIRVEGESAYILSFCLGLNSPQALIVLEESVIDNLKRLCSVSIREKVPTIIGVRMGRPEKAKRREMKPLVHVLFPVGSAGGVHRDLLTAANKPAIRVELSRRKCVRCGNVDFKSKCSLCGSETIMEKTCPICRKVTSNSTCPTCKAAPKNYDWLTINLKELLGNARKNLNGTVFPAVIKGVKGLTNQSKTPEILEKGILRAKYDLSVFKDGTIRFDATNAPLTHFKPKEINVSVDKLRELGYLYDCEGKPLQDEEQICELKIQDIIIPFECARYFVRVANFLDELLEKVYACQPFYNVKQIEDLIGCLVIGLAPHTSVGIVGRIIGFTPLSICYAHPLWHSAKRRDCDGDEDALMLALDVFLNFSREYLPAQIGGIMDAPLFIIPFVNPVEVQRQAHDVDVASFYPLEFYEKTLQRIEAKNVSKIIDLVEHRLNTEAQLEGFKYTVPVSDINLGNVESAYKQLGRMIDKLNAQLGIAEKIVSVDAKKVALKVLSTHFMKDIAGNLRAFSTQSFRCKVCNKRFRRVPLKAKCPECGGALTLTVHRGGIEKYLEAARQLMEHYHLPSYYTQRLIMIREEINSLFEGKKPRQISLADFA
jgi:DNA polymerase II large subunit